MVMAAKRKKTSAEKKIEAFEELRKLSVGTVTIIPCHTETVRRFCEGLEEVHRRSRETPARLRNP
jgi:hypothetical protein